VIAVRPGTDAWRVLACLVADEDGLTVEQIAAHVYPPLRWTEPFRGAADYKARIAARAAHEAGARARVSRLLSRLQERGLVETRGAPRVAEWVQERLHGGADLASLVRRAHPLWPGKVPSVAAHVKLMERIMGGDFPTAKALLKGDSSQESICADLAAWGLIVAPSRRRPTEKGVEYVSNNQGDKT